MKVAFGGKLILLLFALVIAVGVAGWFGRAHSLRLCGDANFLGAQARLPAEWVEAAGRDRFLAPLLRREPIAVLLREFRQRALVIVADPFLFHLSPADKLALTELSRTDVFARAPRFAVKLRALTSSAGCAAQPDPALAARVNAADEYWRSRQNEVRVAKQAFAQDREILCRGNTLIERLRKLLAQAEERCGRTKGGCKRGGLDAMKGEIADLEKQKEFNLHKLERKWPTEYTENFSCASS